MLTLLKSFFALDDQRGLLRTAAAADFIPDRHALAAGKTFDLQRHSAFTTELSACFILRSTGRTLTFRQIS